MGSGAKGERFLEPERVDPSSSLHQACFLLCSPVFESALGPSEPAGNKGESTELLNIPQRALVQGVPRRRRSFSMACNTARFSGSSRRARSR
jgi:hypothetical protein